MTKYWTIEEETKLVEALKIKKEISEIAQEFERTEGGIISRIRKIYGINTFDVKNKYNELDFNKLKAEIMSNKKDTEQFLSKNTNKFLKGKTLFIFDVETTGLPENDKKEYDDIFKLYSNFVDKTTNYSKLNIVQIGWIFIENFDPNKVNEYVKNIKCEIRKPKGKFIIPDESVKFHKITTEIAENKGVGLKKILKDNNFRNMIKKSDYIIAHNAEFDYMMLLSEISKLEMDKLKNVLLEKQNNILCTCKGMNKRYKLSRMYKLAFDKNICNAHTADADVKALLELLCGKCACVIENSASK